MSKDDIKKAIETEPDVIYSPKYGNSLKEFLKKNPDGVDDLQTIARCLMSTPEEIEKILKNAIAKLKKKIK